MKKLFLSPFFACIFTAFCLALYYGISYAFRFKYGVFDIEELGVTDALTNLFYGVAFGIVISLYKDFKNTPRYNTYCCLIFLWFVALLREMGLQHWLAVNDTTAIKIRYFTNPNVPMYAKAASAFIIIGVVAVIAFLLWKHLKQMIVGFFKLNPMYWTIATFGGLGVLTQFTDRFPAHYRKATGDELLEPARFVLKILEEGGESILPLLFAVAFVQYHLLYKRASQNAGGSKATVLD